MMLERSKALQIYFKPGLSEDDLMLRVWAAARRKGRPQEIFRSMLREGLVQLVANGKLDESIIDECGLDAIVERRRHRTSKHTDRPSSPPPVPVQPAPAYGYPGYPHYPHPLQPPAPAPAPAYHEAPAYVPAPPPPAPVPARVIEQAPAPAPVETPREARDAQPAREAVSAPEDAADTAIQRDSDGSGNGPKPQRKLGKLM
jgi:Predicted membrane protein